MQLTFLDWSTETYYDDYRIQLVVEKIYQASTGQKIDTSCSVCFNFHDLGFTFSDASEYSDNFFYDVETGRAVDGIDDEYLIREGEITDLFEYKNLMEMAGNIKRRLNLFADWARRYVDSLVTANYWEKKAATTQEFGFSAESVWDSYWLSRNEQNEIREKLGSLGAPESLFDDLNRQAVEIIEVDGDLYNLTSLIVKEHCLSIAIKEAHES